VAGLIFAKGRRTVLIKPRALLCGYNTTMVMMVVMMMMMMMTLASMMLVVTIETI